MIEESKRVERNGKSENDVEVVNGEKVVLLSFKPGPGFRGLAFRAMTVAARVIRDIEMTT